MDMMTIAEELARQSEQIKSLSDRMGNLEKLTESVNKLAISPERLTARESATEKQVEHLAEDMEGIKGKPAKHWETAIAAVISAIVGAGIALIIK